LKTYEVKITGFSKFAFSNSQLVPLYRTESLADRLYRRGFNNEMQRMDADMSPDDDSSDSEDDGGGGGGGGVVGNTPSPSRSISPGGDDDDDDGGAWVAEEGLTAEEWSEGRDLSLAYTRPSVYTSSHMF
jgi:hypothetical protein